MTTTTSTTISAYEFFQSFPNEWTAIEHIEQLRWPDGVVCPMCDSDRTSRLKTRQYHQCKDCRQKFTVRTGTVFERSHIPLDKWLYAIYILQTARKGVSSLQLSHGTWHHPKVHLVHAPPPTGSLWQHGGSIDRRSGGD